MVRAVGRGEGILSVDAVVVLGAAGEAGERGGDRGDAAAGGDGGWRRDCGRAVTGRGAGLEADGGGGAVVVHRAVERGGGIAGGGRGQGNAGEIHTAIKAELDGPNSAKFPVFFPVSREFGRERFARDCILRH